MRLPDRLTGAALIVLGGFAAYGGSRLPPVPGQQIGPNVFPMVVGGGLILCGALIAWGVGRSFEGEPASEPAGSGSGPPAAPGNLLHKLRVLLPPALLLFYFFVSERLGFVPTAAIIAFITAWSFGASLRLAVPVALLAPLAVHLVFAKLLRVPLPPGLMPMPW